jgi:hypothetical protein
MKTGKKTRQLPLRGAVKDLTQSGMTINDYAKASPVQQDKADPSVIQNLRPITKVF